MLGVLVGWVGHHLQVLISRFPLVRFSQTGSASSLVWLHPTTDSSLCNELNVIQYKPIANGQNSRFYLHHAIAKS